MTVGGSRVCHARGLLHGIPATIRGARVLVDFGFVAMQLHINRMPKFVWEIITYLATSEVNASSFLQTMDAEIVT